MPLVIKRFMFDILVFTVKLVVNFEYDVLAVYSLCSDIFISHKIYRK